MKRLDTPFVTLFAVLITVTLTSNIIASKLIILGSATAPAGVLVFPISYLVSDLLAEIYGYKMARNAVLAGFACNALAVAIYCMALALPGSPYWHAQDAMQVVLGQTPRLVLASFVAYLVGQVANVWVFNQVKRLTGGRFLWMRAYASTALGEALDTAIFITIAFSFILPTSVVLGMILTQWIVKMVIEVLGTPITYATRAYITRKVH